MNFSIFIFYLILTIFLLNKNLILINKLTNKIISDIFKQCLRWKIININDDKIKNALIIKKLN